MGNRYDSESTQTTQTGMLKEKSMVASRGSKIGFETDMVDYLGRHMVGTLSHFEGEPCVAVPSNMKAIDLVTLNKPGKIPEGD